MKQGDGGFELVMDGQKVGVAIKDVQQHAQHVLKNCPNICIWEELKRCAMVCCCYESWWGCVGRFVVVIFGVFVIVIIVVVLHLVVCLLCFILLCSSIVCTRHIMCCHTRGVCSWVWKVSTILGVEINKELGQHSGGVVKHILELRDGNGRRIDGEEEDQWGVGRGIGLRSCGAGGVDEGEWVDVVHFVLV